MAKILCIEDDGFIVDMYAHALKKAGHDITVIANGTEALQEAKQTVYDIILLDLMLPDTSGVEILEALRGANADGLPLTKIIVTTNFDEPAEDRARLERMADGYIIKADVVPSQLVEIIEQMINQKEK